MHLIRVIDKAFVTNTAGPIHYYITTKQPKSPVRVFDKDNNALALAITGEECALVLMMLMSRGMTRTTGRALANIVYNLAIMPNSMIRTRV